MNTHAPIAFFTQIQAELEPQRHAAEVRYVAAMETDARRRIYLNNVHDERGEECYRRLRADVWTYIQRSSA